MPTLNRATRAPGLPAGAFSEWVFVLTKGVAAQRTVAPSRSVGAMLSKSKRLSGLAPGERAIISGRFDAKRRHEKNYTQDEQDIDQIVFTSVRTGNFEIFTIRPDGFRAAAIDPRSPGRQAATYGRARARWTTVGSGYQDHQR